MQPPMFLPASTKRPHWVLLGFESRLRRAGPPQRHVVMGRPLVSYTTDSGELRVVQEACPHRGASLAEGSVEGACVACPYHGARVGVPTHPHMFYDYAALQGFVWLDVARNLITQHVMPPYYPEFSSKSFRTTEYTKDVAANPVVLTEHLLDWPHDGEAKAVRSTGPYGKAVREHTTPAGALEVETAYHVPFTTSLRFTLAGEVVALAVFSVLPVSASGVRLHVRFARTIAKMAEMDALFRAEVPLHEAVVSGVDPGEWSRNHLGPGDVLLEAYREAMRRFFPDMLDFYVG